MDGASLTRLPACRVFPQLRPVTLAALIIVGHMSMKSVFDLVVSIGGKWLHRGAGGLHVDPDLTPSDYAKAAAIAIRFLLVVAVLVVPYLVSTVRSERRSYDRAKSSTLLPGRQPFRSTSRAPRRR